MNIHKLSVVTEQKKQKKTALASSLSRPVCVQFVWLHCLYVFE